MADPDTTTRLIIQLGDGGDPETFGFTCGANSFGITLTNNLGEDTVLDCVDPLDVPAKIMRYLESQDTSATISGKVAKSAFATWRGWADNGTMKNIKILLDEPAASNGGFWTVPAYLGSLELNKQGSATAEFTATISGAGSRVWTDAT